jgi:hypothetical protein
VVVPKTVDDCCPYARVVVDDEDADWLPTLVGLERVVLAD